MSQARSRQGADQRAFARTRAAGDDDEIIPSGFQVHGSAVQLVLDRLGGSESQLLRRRDLDRLAIGGIAALPRWARSEEHTSELQSLMRISYAVFCLKKKNTNKHITSPNTHVTTQQPSHP